MKTGWNLLLILTVCSACDIFDIRSVPVCDPLGPRPSLKVLYTKEATQCAQPDGELAVEAKTGKSPFRYSIGGESVNFSGVFNGLNAGEYKVSVIDANNCEGIVTVKVPSGLGVMNASALTAPDDKCFSNNGKIFIKVINGSKPYQYLINELPYQSDSVFYQLDKGMYKVQIRDANQCQFQFYIPIVHGYTGVSYSRDVQPIISRNCNMAGCHNGDAGASINFTQFNTVRWYGMILVNYAGKQHRQPPLPQQEINFIRCWVEDGKLDN